MAKCAWGVMLALISALALIGCQTLGSDTPPARLTTAENGDCERLAPLVVNADGSLTRDQLESGLKGDFKKWDKDSDGALNDEELVPLNASLRGLNAGASPVMDWNADGRVSFAEFASGWRTMFTLCSREGNVVTKADMVRSPKVAPRQRQPQSDDETIWPGAR